MTRSRVKAAAESYRYSLAQVESRRERLRQQVIGWNAKGATIVEIAETLGWSRQSVYDLIGRA